MKLLDRIALNRLISIITSFVLAILKIIVPKQTDTKRLPKRRKTTNE